MGFASVHTAYLHMRRMCQACLPGLQRAGGSRVAYELMMHQDENVCSLTLGALAPDW